MPTLIQIPASEVLQAQKRDITLHLEGRCSRCGSSPADYFEVHHVYYHEKLKREHLVGKKYQTSKRYWVKISVCENCFQADYLTHPELLDRSAPGLGRIARFHSIAWTLGALLAAMGFITLTPFVPDKGIFASIKDMWQIPVAVGVVVLLLTWLSQHKYQTTTMRRLEQTAPNYRPLPRAEVITIIQENGASQAEICLEIVLNNEPWAIAVAEKNGWIYKNTEIVEPEPTNQEK